MAGKVTHRKLGTKNCAKLEKELLATLRCMQKGKNVSPILALFTVSERIMLARRLQIAKRLLAGQRPAAIRRELRVGQTTVESIERWLRERCADYQDLFPRLYAELRAKERRSRPIIPYSFRWARRKYPMHFLLFNLFLDDIDWSKGR